ncbi:Hypothetical protein DEACI_3775, partial [Acididesulfobacillus acetoxydans]
MSGSKKTKGSGKREDWGNEEIKEHE